MAPRERRNSDPRQTIVRDAAADILQGVFDGAPAGGHPNTSQPAPATPGGQPGIKKSASNETKEKIRRQLDAAKEAPKEATIHRELQDSVDTCLRSLGELSDTESIVDDLEFEFQTRGGKCLRSRVARSDTVAKLRRSVIERSGEKSKLLLNGKALTTARDKQLVYQLWREGFARRSRPYKLQMVARFDSG